MEKIENARITKVSITMEEADLKEQQAQTKGQISTIEKLIDLMSNWKNDY